MLMVENVRPLDTWIEWLLCRLHECAERFRQSVTERFSYEQVSGGQVAGVSRKREIGRPFAEKTQDRQQPKQRDDQDKTRIFLEINRSRDPRSRKQNDHQGSHREVPGPDDEIVVVAPRSQKQKSRRVDSEREDDCRDSSEAKPQRQPDEDFHERRG